MSFSRARFGLKPSGAASPPQKGSTYRLDECDCQSDARFGTSQRFPPAHFKGGFSEFSCRCPAKGVSKAVSEKASETLCKAGVAAALATLRRPAARECFASKRIFALTLPV